MSSTKYVEILFEDINDKFDRLLEIIQGMQKTLAQKADRSDLDPIYRRLDNIEFYIKTNSPVVKDHEKRIAKLEKYHPKDKSAQPI